MTVPVALFAYARADLLTQTLDCLRENAVPLLYVFCDGPRTKENLPAVQEARELVHAIDWCETRIIERDENLGLGRSIITGMTEVFAAHEMAIVFEDDLICVPGTYAYLSSALEHYRDDPRVFSVTAWTHPKVTPLDINDKFYFSGRAECLTWGAYRRTWESMPETTALQYIEQCKRQGIPPDRYGADLPLTAQLEAKMNVWAVRFIYRHISAGGLCLRPPYSMVEHIGFDSRASNAKTSDEWANPPLRPAPPLPSPWPIPVENLESARLWRKANAQFTPWIAYPRKVIRKGQRILLGSYSAMRLRK